MSATEMRLPRALRFGATDVQPLYHHSVITVLFLNRDFEMVKRSLFVSAQPPLALLDASSHKTIRVLAFMQPLSVFRTVPLHSPRRKIMELYTVHMKPLSEQALPRLLAYIWGTEKQETYLFVKLAANHLAPAHIIAYTISFLFRVDKFLVSVDVRS